MASGCFRVSEEVERDVWRSVLGMSGMRYIRSSNRTPYIASHGNSISEAFGPNDTTVLHLAYSCAMPRGRRGNSPISISFDDAGPLAQSNPLWLVSYLTAGFWEGLGPEIHSAACKIKVNILDSEDFRPRRIVRITATDYWMRRNLVCYLRELPKNRYLLRILL